jgi:hypothetical protein
VDIRFPASHDQCRGDDLDPAEHDEYAGADGDRLCRGQQGRQARSHAAKAGWLMPAEQRDLIMWTICGR